MKFVILSNQRCGSNWLQMSLNQIDNVHVHGEVFIPKKYHLYHKARQLNKFQRLLWTINIRTTTGVLYKYNHIPRDMSLPELLAVFKNNNTVVIHLKRRNLVEIHLSGQDRLKKYRERRHNIDIQRMTEQIDTIQTHQNIVSEALISQAAHHINVYYEDLVANPKETFDRICNFINVAPGNLSMSTRNNDPKRAQCARKTANVASRIINWGDIREVIVDRYPDMLEDCERNIEA